MAKEKGITEKWRFTSMTDLDIDFIDAEVPGCINFAKDRIMNANYRHTQRAPLCLLVYATAVMLLALGWGLRNEPPIKWLFPPVGLVMLVLAGSFHHLTVEDEVDKLSASFGPIPLFRRTIRYENIVSVELGRTTILDGWGIHVSFRGGWVWNIWGRDCVVLRLRKGILRVGSDDAEQLADFLNARLSKQ